MSSPRKDPLVIPARLPRPPPPKTPSPVPPYVDPPGDATNPDASTSAHADDAERPSAPCMCGCTCLCYCACASGAYQLGEGKMDYHLHLEMWRGNVAGAVQLAMQRNELSDWIVAMAPMASRETWEKVCAAYAEQLEDDGQYYKAVSYLLACHRVVDAIELFQRHALYREAVSLAKVRLSPIDPILEGLYMEWGAQLIKDGQFEQSAKCYLAMKQVQEAGRIVAKRHDLPSLKTACHMSLVVQEQDQALVYAYQTFSQYLLAAQWKDATSFLQSHEGLHVFQPVVYAHELLVQQLALLCPGLTLTQKPVTDDSNTTGEEAQPAKKVHPLPEFMLDRSDMDPVVPWEPILFAGDVVSSPGKKAGSEQGPEELGGPRHTFPHHLLRIWNQRLDVTMVTKELKSTRAAIDRLTKIRPSLMCLPSLLIMLSVDVASCLLALLASETSTAISHLIQAMAALHTAGTATVGPGADVCRKMLLPAFCRLMLSQGPKYMLKLQQEFKASRVLLTMDSDGDVALAGGEGSNSIKRFLTDIKEDESTISTNSTWCRELDCLRAYYYLSVLDYIQECQAEEERVPPSPSSAKSQTQENDSVDGEPTSEGSTSSLPPATPGSSQDLEEGKSPHKEKEQTSEESKEALPEHSQDFDQNGRSATGADSLVTKQLPAVQRSLSGGSPVDPVPSSLGVSPSRGATASSVCSPEGKPRLRHPSTSSLTHSDQQSPKRLTPLSPTKSSPSNPSPASKHSHASSPSSHQSSPSHHITSITNSPQTPGSKSRLAAGLSGSIGSSNVGKLNKSNLLRLSKGVLWDTQAKSEVLTETLGYIHRAISQHLLVNRGAKSSDPTPTNTATSSTTAGADAAAAGDSPTRSAAGDKTQATSAETSGAHPSSPASLQPQPDDPEDDGSIQQRRSSPSGPTPASPPQGASLSPEANTPKRGSSPSGPTPASPPQGASLSPGAETPQQAGPDPPCQESPKQEEPQPAARPKSVSPQPVSKPSVKSPSSALSGPKKAPSVTDVKKEETSKPPPKAPVRSLSESNAMSPPPPAKSAPQTSFDRRIGLQAERDLLGEFAGEPISFSNSKKVLFLDNIVKPSWPSSDGALPPSSALLRAAAPISKDVKSERVALLAPDGSALPVEWDELPVDVKFTKCYVTMALLRHQQDAILMELKKGPDMSKIPFPSKSSGVRRLLECCVKSKDLPLEDKKAFIKQLSDWSMLFSVTTHEKAETEALFKNIPAECVPEKTAKKSGK